VTINTNIEEKIIANYNQLTLQVSILYALRAAKTWSQKAEIHTHM